MNFINSFDQIILLFVHNFPGSLHALMIVITSIGSPPVCLALLIVALVYAYLNKNKRLLRPEIILLLTTPLASILKELTKRVRPDSVYVDKMIFKTYSFPSGHAYLSLLIYGFFTYLAWKYIKTSLKWPAIGVLIVLIFLVGLSRIYLGAHFPSDVFGGWVLAAVVLFLVIKYGRGKSKFPKN